jgi:peptide/nickel transport system substrate-binding protein
MMYKILTVMLFCLGIMLAGVFPLSLAQDSFYQEAPLLAERVAAGELPPVDERLPRNPMLITPYESVGVYGGTWDMAMVQGDYFFLHRTLGYENLLRWDERWVNFVPNVAQSVTATADSTTFTVELREGMRWSDGHPFTSADILFWYEAVYLNLELVNRIGAPIRAVGNNLTVTTEGDYRVVFQFEQPNGLFLQRMASGLGSEVTNMPRHYLQQFHADYSPNVNQLVAEAGLADWTELFVQKLAVQSLGRPSLFAWVVESHDETSLRAVRNPYYWKVDTAFNQLPYMDAVEFAIVASRDDMLPLIADGQIDMQDRNLPLVATQINSGGLQRYELLPAFSNYMAISFNQTHADPVKRQILQNREFRIGLSHAINRDAIIEASGLDVAARQVSPLEGTPFYSEQGANQYLAYDVGLANEYLDQAGYAQRDANDLRLGPDGQPIRLTFLLAVPVVTTNYDVHLAQIQADWRAVGVELTVERLPRREAEIRWSNNDFDLSAWVGEGGYDAILDPRYYVPSNFYWSLQGVLWARWYINPLDPLAEEPPTTVLDNINRYRQISNTADFDQQNAIMAEVIAAAATDFYNIGIHEMPTTYGILRPNFHNVPSRMFFASNYLNPGPTNPAQYFIDPQDD